MRQHRDSKATGRSAVRAQLGWEVIALVSIALTSACSSGDHANPDEDELGDLEQALYDSSDIRTTAGSAMVDAYLKTLANADRFEYCGLIVRKADLSFRAGVPTTSNLSQFCGATIDLAGGEKLVGYYHTHTAASAPGISSPDKTEANRRNLEYFVLSTVTGCGQQYSPSSGKSANLGCPF